MRRRGAAHAAKRMRVEAAAAPSKTFPAARRKLNEVLKAFAFVKVIEVTHVPAQAGRPAFYHGVAVTTRNSRFVGGDAAEHVFFDKGGRLRFNSTFDVGPCRLIDAALGRDHPSANPQVGDILVGMLTDNPRAAEGGGGAGGYRRTAPRLPKVVRSWSRHGNIVMELSRMVEHGTAMPEAETRGLLRQAESAMGHAASLAAGLAGSAGHAAIARSAATAIAAADDFWMLARLVLWGSVRPLAVLHALQSGTPCKVEPTEVETTAARDLRLSTTAAEFVTGLAVRLEDPSLLTAFTDELNMPAPAPTPAAAYVHHNVGGHIIAAAVVPAHALPPGSYAVASSPATYSGAGAGAGTGGVWGPYASAPAAYAPMSPAYAPQHASSPAYAPASAAIAAGGGGITYTPASPPYAPAAAGPASGSGAIMYTPASPPYAPAAAGPASASSAIMYTPASPPYAPAAAGQVSASGAITSERTSSVQPQSPQYAPQPQSPQYAPQSPQYMPQSPQYAPPAAVSVSAAGAQSAPRPHDEYDPMFPTQAAPAAAYAFAKPYDPSCDA